MQKNFSENVCLRTKFDFRLKKQKKNGAKCRIWKLYGKHFFQKKFIISFFLSPVCSTVLKKPQKWFIFFYCFSKTYENFMTSIFSIHLMYGIV